MLCEASRIGKFIETEVEQHPQGLEGGRNGEYRVPIWGEKNLEIDSDDGCPHWECN